MSLNVGFNGRPKVGGRDSDVGLGERIMSRQNRSMCISNYTLPIDLWQEKSGSGIIMVN